MKKKKAEVTKDEEWERLHEQWERLHEQCRQKLVALYEELYRADDDYPEVRRILTKIRAEVGRQEIIFGDKPFRNDIDLDVLWSHFVFAIENGRLPTIAELHRKANESAKSRGTSYSERGVRKAAKWRELPIAAAKLGPRR